MSADNGIYIGCFPDGFRVIHAQAIENCDDGDGFPQNYVDATRVIYYGDATLYKHKEDARKKAFEMYDEIMEGDMPILEYGISEVEYDRLLPSITKRKARKTIEDYWYKTKV